MYCSSVAMLANMLATLGCTMEMSGNTEARWGCTLAKSSSCSARLEYDGDAAYGDVAPNGEALYGEVMVAIGEVGMKGDVGE